MPSAALTTNENGHVIIPTGAVPVFIWIGDSIAEGNTQAHTIPADKQSVNGDPVPNLSFTTQTGTPGAWIFDQHLFFQKVSDQWDENSPGAGYMGKNYLQNGNGNTDYATGDVRPRIVDASGPGTNWDAADMIQMHPYQGALGDKPFPADKLNPEDGNNELIDLSPLYIFAGQMAFLFKETGGSVAAFPRFIHYGVASSAVGQLTDSLRRASWSPDYTAPVNGAGDQVSAYECFHDMYLKPALDAIIAQGDTPYIAGIVCMLGSNDCTNKNNRKASTFDYLGSPGGNEPARRCAANLVALTDEIISALGAGVTNVPVIYLRPSGTGPEAVGKNAQSDVGWAGLATKDLTALCKFDTYKAPTTMIRSRGTEEHPRQRDKDGVQHMGSDGIHPSATGANRLGKQFGDLYKATFLDQDTPILIYEASAISNLTA